MDRAETYHKDGPRAYTRRYPFAHKKNGAVNLSAMRKYALEMLKKQDDKLSLKR